VEVAGQEALDKTEQAVKVVMGVLVIPLQYLVLPQLMEEAVAAVVKMLMADQEEVVVVV
jgi:hypothetical protein